MEVLVLKSRISDMEGIDLIAQQTVAVSILEAMDYFGEDHDGFYTWVGDH